MQPFELLEFLLLLLLNQLALLFGVSPWAGSVLSSRPELLDSFILRQDLDLIEEFRIGKDISLVLDSLSERRLMGELLAILNYLETKDLENFVNAFKAEFDIKKNNAFSNFKLVTGELIRQYYCEDSYYYGKSGKSGYDIYGNPLCRITQFTKNEVDKWNNTIPLIKEADKQFKLLVPDRHKKVSNGNRGMRYNEFTR
jgi:hypothetical protein